MSRSCVELKLFVVYIGAVMYTVGRVFLELPTESTVLLRTTHRLTVK